MIQLTNDPLALRKLNPISLITNMKMAEEMAEALTQIISEDQLHGTCLSMFNELVTELAEDAPEMIQLFNFLGLAFEQKMNIAKMQAEADKRVINFKTEIERRLKDASA